MSRFVSGTVLLLLIAACGPEKSSRAPIVQEVTEEFVTEKGLKSFPPPEDILDERDVLRIANVLPTMYYTPRESEVACAGTYRRRKYSGKEKVKLLTREGKAIATVCGRFSAVLLMEGSGVLRDRGQGPIAINYGGKVRGTHRYHRLGRCQLGEGIRKDLCLLPYHTIAADNRIHLINEIVYVPAARGIALPDGSIHDGFFIVRDTGGAFQGIGAQRVDLFTGTDPDFNNAFQRAGFHHKNPLEAYKVSGDSAEFIREKLKEKFGELY